MTETRNRVAQNTTTTGTGTLTLGSAVAQHFALQAGDDGKAFDWVLVDANGTAVEIGRDGVYTHSGTTFTRPTIERSTNSDAAISLSAGTHTVFLTPSAQRMAELEDYRVARPDTSFPVAADYPGGVIPDGAQFYHQGRKILYVYEQAWVPTMSYGDLTIYVDGTNGTDDDDHGFASGGDAKATIQAGWDAIPSVINGNVTLNIASGSYTEDLALGGKQLGGSYYIHVVGATTLGTEYTFSSGADYGNEAALPNVGYTLTVTGSPGWSGEGFWKITGGTGEGKYYPGFDSSGANIYIPGRGGTYGGKIDTAAAANNLASIDTTTLDGTSKIKKVTLDVTVTGNCVIGNQNNLFFETIKFTASSAYVLDIGSMHGGFIACYIVGTGSSASPAISRFGCNLTLISNIFTGANTIGHAGLYINGISQFVAIRNVFDANSAVASCYGLFVTKGGMGLFYCNRMVGSSYATNACHGIKVTQNCLFQSGYTNTKANTLYTPSTNASSHGIDISAGSGGQVIADADNWIKVGGAGSRINLGSSDGSWNS